MPAAPDKTPCEFADPPSDHHPQEAAQGEWSCAECGTRLRRTTRGFEPVYDQRHRMCDARMVSR